VERLTATLPTAHQQPAWEDTALLAQVREELTDLPGLVTSAEVRRLRTLLAGVVAGEYQVLQAGDCAEDPTECTSRHVERKTALLDILADVLMLKSGRPVLRVGRIAGQFGKPRSQPVEIVGGRQIPVYRGHMVNSPDPDPELRRPDPKRLLSGYWAASTAMDAIRARNGTEPTVWTSHEALLLDYEVPMLREDADGVLLSSTHWPWIGERTRQLDGAHVTVLSTVVNPVACKVGPGMTVDDLLGLCARLDPDREPGRLTLIARMGSESVATRLPGLAGAVREAGHPVIWMCDPMHGNTVQLAGGLKTRYVATVIAEVERFTEVMAREGAVAGGLHLEATPDHVTECVAGPDHVHEAITGPYTSLCDPRLNVAQAVEVVSAWPE
jgi:3-deoxy-7-phosphoheptulonate synthase